MVALHGADLEEMAELARRLEVASAKLSRITDQATVTTNTIHRLWQGPDADEARQVWLKAHRPRLVAAAKALAEASATVERNRKAQEETSAEVSGSGDPL